MNQIVVQNMSVTERIHAMDALWESLLNENIDLASPEWHEDILRERRNRLSEGSMKFMTISELKKRISG